MVSKRLDCLFGRENEVTCPMRDLNVSEMSKLPTSVWSAKSQGSYNFHPAWGSCFCYVKQGGCAALSTCLHWTNLLFSPCLFSPHPDRCEGVQVHHRFFFPSADDKVPGLVRDISCLTVASCLVTFRLLLLWRLWGPFDLQHYWSGCTPWQGPNDYFSSSLWVTSEETHFVLLSHCWEIYLFLTVTDFIWRKKYTFFLPKEENALMKHFCVSSHYSVVASSRNLCPSFSSNSWLFWAFPSMLVISGSCLGLFQYPSLHLYLKKKSFLCILPLFSLGRRQKGGTACGKVTPFRPVNTKWGWENPLLCRPGDAVPDAEMKRWWLFGGFLGWGWRSRSERRDSCGGSRIHSPAPCLHSVAFLGTAKQVPVGWLAVGIAQGAAGWWKGSREPAPAYGLEVWLP